MYSSQEYHQGDNFHPVFDTVNLLVSRLFRRLGYVRMHVPVCTTLLD